MIFQQNQQQPLIRPQQNSSPMQQRPPMQRPLLQRPQTLPRPQMGTPATPMGQIRPQPQMNAPTQQPRLQGLAPQQMPMSRMAMERPDVGMNRMPLQQSQNQGQERTMDMAGMQEQQRQQALIRMMGQRQDPMAMMQRGQNPGFRDTGMIQGPPPSPEEIQAGQMQTQQMIAQARQQDELKRRQMMEQDIIQQRGY